MEAETVLRKLGLSDKEATVYVALLMLGSSKVSAIAARANLLRETTYAVLKSLKEKGLVTYVIKSGIKYFDAVDPELLLRSFKEKERSLIEILPTLQEVKKTGIHLPKIEMYEGTEGFKTLLRDMIAEKNTELQGYVHESITTFLPVFSLQFRRERREKKIFLKVITTPTEFTREIKKKDKDEFRETRFHPTIPSTPIGYYISKNKVFIVKATRKEQIGIKIEDQDLAKVQKDIFEELWKQTKP
jgi:sugar-specific transcriptional regulator TrmB